MFNLVHRFIRNIQRSSERSRRFWLVALSAGAMFIVIFLWVTYINVTVDTVSAIADTEQPAPVVSAEQKVGFIGTFMAGLRVIMENLKQAAATTNSFTFEKQQRNFIVDRLQPIPATQLP